LSYKAVPVNPRGHCPLILSEGKETEGGGVLAEIRTYASRVTDTNRFQIKEVTAKHVGTHKTVKKNQFTMEEKR
jgi:hypothetical protein